MLMNRSSDRKSRRELRSGRRDIAIICVEFYLQGADRANHVFGLSASSFSSFLVLWMSRRSPGMCEVCLCQRLHLSPYDITDPRATDIDDRDDWCDFGTIDLGTVPTALKISSDRVSSERKEKVKLATFTFPRTLSCRSDDRWIPDKPRVRKKCCSETVRFLPADPGRSWPVEATTIWSSTDQALSRESPSPLSAHVSVWLVL